MKHDGARLENGEVAVLERGNLTKGMNREMRRLLQCLEGNETNLVRLPYLFQGPRPELTTVPQAPVGYNQYFPVGTTSTGITKAVLVAPITSTHSIDTSQRYLELTIANTGKNQLLLKSPQDAQAAPPGYYMLFLLDAKGVPSIAKWVQLDPNA